MKQTFLLILFLLVPMLASADDSGYCGDNITYFYEEATHTLTISGTGEMNDYWGNNPWNTYKQEILSVIIEDGVTSISSDSFQGCGGLTSVTIPNTVTSIGSNAFIYCGLTSVTIPNSVTSIGEGAFCQCRGLTSVTIPNSVTYIGESAFALCSRLTSVTIPQGMTFIAQGTFYQCTGLTSVTIPNSVTSIEEGAFDYCISLTSVTIPDGVTSIGPDAFRECIGLTSITIPNSVTSIGGSAFEDCFGLKMVKSEISTPFYVGTAFIWEPNNIEALGLDYMGEIVRNRAILIVPKGSRAAYKSVRGWDFAYIYEEGETIYDIEQTDEQGVRYTLRQADEADDYSLYYAVTGHTDELNAEIVIPAEIDGCPVRNIGYSAFNGCTNLLSVTIPNSVTTIWNSAFKGCSSLTSVTIPNSVTTISNEAFSDCSSLTSVSLEEGLTSIGDRAFSGCYFASITIPTSVETIGESAFIGNTRLATAILGDGITEIASNTFCGCSALTSIIIPDGVTRIGSYAFMSCDALTSVKLSESLTSMGDGVFLDCPLNSIELPNSFTVIPEGLFSGNDFQYIKLGNNVKNIGKSAFGSSDPVIEIGTSTPPTIDKDAFPHVTYLADLTVIVPDEAAESAYRKAAVWEEMTFANQNNVSEVTVDTPGDLSFELITECEMMPAKVVGLKVNGTINDDDFTQMLVNMKSLLRLDLSDCNITEIPDEALKGKTQLRELTLPSKLKTIGRSAFQDCTYLTGELKLPSTVTTIGEYAFVGTDYTSVKLSSALKTIGDYAFNNVPLKQKLTLPNKVTSVGAYAFAGTKIQSLIIPDAVTSIGDYAFADTHISGHVEIPEGIMYLGIGAFRNTQIEYASAPDNPDGLTSISRELFQGCSNLEYIYIPRNFTDVSGYAFDGCSNLSYVRLSPNLVTMGEYAFQNTKLEYIKVPSKVEVLSQGVLKNCSSLESLSLPANLKTVEAEALTGCTSLRNLSVEAIEPPVINDRSSIRGINTDLCLISIPTESYRAYVLAEYWGRFVQMRNDIAVETEGDGEIAFESVDEEEDEVAEARARGQRFAATRGGTRASTDEDESLTFANNGSSIYIPKQGKVRFYILPGEGEELLSATLDGEDIKSFIKDGVYTATADKKSAKLIVKFSGSKLEGDANGDDKVNVVDIVHLVNAKASQSEIDKVVKILMGK